MKGTWLGRLAGLAQVVLAGLVLLLPLKAQTPAGQAGAAAQPQYKGIFEPVNYPEDLAFTDVYFVTVDVGYVAGQGATIGIWRDSWLRIGPAKAAFSSPTKTMAWCARIMANPGLPRTAGKPGKR